MSGSSSIQKRGLRGVLSGITTRLNRQSLDLDLRQRDNPHEILAYLCAAESWRQRVDSSRVGLMGFSAGGLATLLSAADEPGPAIWVGLDPVDRVGIGAKAAPLVTCRAVVLTAEPSVCNAQGNARGIIAVLPHGEHFMVAGAVHVDAEWPTDWVAEAVCGRSTDEKRSEFRRRATTALREALSMPAVESLPVLIEERRDPGAQPGVASPLSTAPATAPAGPFASTRMTALAQGGRFGGWSLYVKDGVPAYAYNFLGLKQTSIAAGRARAARARSLSTDGSRIPRRASSPRTRPPTSGSTSARRSSSRSAPRPRRSSTVASRR